MDGGLVQAGGRGEDVRRLALVQGAVAAQQLHIHAIVEQAALALPLQVVVAQVVGEAPAAVQEVAVLSSLANQFKRKQAKVSVHTQPSHPGCTAPHLISQS